MIDQILEILFEEDNPRIVAIYGGGFKPPTKGHFAVVEKTLSEFSEIDELIVYVGGGVRDGITQEESIKIWEIYKNYLSPKVKVLPSIAPVKSILDYAKENPTDKVYWVLGAREGDEDDIKDIENRTRSVEKYPNLEVKVITTKGGVSGTKTRQAIKAGNKEQFFHFIPDVEEKEEIWTLVIPVVKEIKNKRAEIIKAKKAKMEAKKSLEEGFIENTQENMKKLFLAIKQEGKETRDAFKLVLQATKGEIQLTDEQKKQIGDQLKDVLRTIGLVSIAALPGGFIVGALIKIFKAERLVFPSSLMNEVGEASAKVYSYKSNISPEWLFYKADNYFKDNSIKKSYTDQLIYTFSTGKAEYIVPISVEMEKQTYINFSKNPDWKPGPPYKTYARVDFTTEGNPDEKATNLNEQFAVLSTITNIVIDFINKFNETGGNIILIDIFPKADSDEGSKIDSKRGKLYAAYIKKNLSKIPGYSAREKTSSEGNEHIEIYKTNSINELVTSTDVICDNCGWEWPIADGGDDLYICHKCGHDNNPDLEEGTCGYDTDVKTGEKLDTPGGLEEGKQVGPLYHYTSANGLKGILQSNKINASEENYLGNELYYISFTRNKNFHKKGSKFGVQTEYRITLDGDKLSNKYKIRPFAYIPGWDIEDSWELDWLDDEPESVRRDFFNATGDYDEQEERIFFKNENGGIDNIKNYILSVDKVEDLQEGRKKKPDPKKGTGKKPEGSGRRLYTDEDPKDTVSIKFKTKEDIVDTLNKASFKAKSHARQSQIINLIHQRVRAAYGKAKDPEVKSRLKRALDYIESRKEASKEKTERLRKMKEASDPQAGTALPYGSGFAPVKEAKELNIQDLAYKQIPGLLEKGINYELAHFRGFMRSFYKWSGSKDKNDFFDFIENVKGEVKRVPLSSIKPSQSGNDYKNPSSEYEAEEFQKILDGEESVENHRKEDFYPILVNKRDNKILDGNHRHYALSAINSPYAVVLYVDVPKQYLKEKNDPFGLNELAKDFVKEVFEETWNPKDSFVSLTKYMIDNGMNIKPLPKIKVIDNDAENASRLLGKTAHYDPAEKSITLFTMNRHPKDVLRSFAHEMIHHEQNLENRLGSITTTNTNEDGDLPEIEREAYEKGNMMLRNWEDSIKSSVNEIYFLDIPKFNYPKTLEENLWHTLNEITLNPSNAVEIEGDEFEGEFKVGDIEYTYFIDYIDSPYGGESDFYSIAFDEKYNTSKNIPTGNAKENYIKILSTMYKIILNFTQSQKPEYIGIASMDNMGSKNYHTIYANLTDNKSNRIPGYFRKDVNLPFNTPQGKGRMVVLKRKDV